MHSYKIKKTVKNNICCLFSKFTRDAFIKCLAYFLYSLYNSIIGRMVMKSAATTNQTKAKQTHPLKKFKL
jgi:hypothetical protein